MLPIIFNQSESAGARVPIFTVKLKAFVGEFSIIGKVRGDIFKQNKQKM
jgi:hypothetical protein